MARQVPSSAQNEQVKLLNAFVRLLSIHTVLNYELAEMHAMRWPMHLNNFHTEMLSPQRNNRPSLHPHELCELRYALPLNPGDKSIIP